MVKYLGGAALIATGLSLMIKYTGTPDYIAIRACALAGVCFGAWLIRDSFK